jgi:hypothetical protein
MQTGADHAALEVAIEKGIPHGGWIPKGRLNEVGMLPEKYHGKEMETPNSRKRTEPGVNFRLSIRALLCDEFSGKGYDIRKIQGFLGQKDVKTKMIYTHVLNLGGKGVKSPAEGLQGGVLCRN